MKDLEMFIVEHINDKKFKFPNDFNPSEKYSDEFYDRVREVFEKNKKKRYLYRFIKWLFDFLVSIIMIILLSLVFIIVSIAIKINSRGPIVFKQERMGKNFNPFKCWKFRSMYTSAPANEASNLLENSEMHITKVGKFLRKTSLDELAQLFNVLSGKMSFIGYRPIILTEKGLNDYRNELGVFSIKPGITGYTQIHGRDFVYYKNKAIMDAYYVKRASLWLDIKILFGTIGVVLFRKGNNDK